MPENSGGIELEFVVSFPVLISIVSAKFAAMQNGQNYPIRKTVQAQGLSPSVCEHRSFFWIPSYSPMCVEHSP
jgi:hypothetical protein